MHHFPPLRDTVPELWFLLVNIKLTFIRQAGFIARSECDSGGLWVGSINYCQSVTLEDTSCGVSPSPSPGYRLIELIVVNFFKTHTHT